MTTKQFIKSVEGNYRYVFIRVLTPNGYIEHRKKDGRMFYKSLAMANAARLALQESGRYGRASVEVWAENVETDWPERVI